MKKTQNSTLYVCGCCKRSLPSEAFYIDKKTGRPGNYCKECRKSTSRKQRDINKTLAVNRSAEYPVITRTSDPVLRKELILRALKTVAASIEEKKRKRLEVELETDCFD